MKILLAAVNAKYIHSNLAVHSLRAYSLQRGLEAALAEYTINQDYHEILRDIYEKKPDVVAFSCYIWNIGLVRNVAEELKKVLPEVIIWAGGPEVSYDPENQLAQYPFLDGIMRGEGEKTFLELMRFYHGSAIKLSQINGIVYRQGRDIKDTGFRTPMDMDELVFPYSDMRDFAHKIIYYETSRGCPYACSYCLSSIEKGIRLRSLPLVKKELQFFLEHKVKQVKFVDRTFNCVKKHAMAIWRFILEHDNGVTNFHFEIAADILTEEEILLLQKGRPGLIQLEIGVQTIHEETIHAIHRKMDLEKLASAVGRVREGRNIHQHLDLIAGLPLEDMAHFRNSFNYVYRMRPDQLQLGFLKILKGSAMYEDSPKYGIVYESRPPYEVLYTEDMSFEEMTELKRVEEMLEVYYNSAQFTSVIRFLEHYFETPYAIYHYMAEFYQLHNFFAVSHSRIARCQILRDMMREFGESFLSGREETENWYLALDSLLLYDLYVRENLKSRPDFAPLTEETKNAGFLFFKETEYLHGMLPQYKPYDRKQMSRMMHLEAFPVDVELASADGTIRRENTYVLFDYSKRDPLNHQASVYRVDGEWKGRH